MTITYSAGKALSSEPETWMMAVTMQRSVRACASRKTGPDRLVPDPDHPEAVRGQRQREDDRDAGDERELWGGGPDQRGPDQQGGCRQDPRGEHPEQQGARIGKGGIGPGSGGHGLRPRGAARARRIGLHGSKVITFARRCLGSSTWPAAATGRSTPGSPPIPWPGWPPTTPAAGPGTPGAGGRSPWPGSSALTPRGTPFAASAPSSSGLEAPRRRW